jgi:hypothetical protein
MEARRIFDALVMSEATRLLYLQFVHPLNRTRLDVPSRESICRTEKAG